MPYKTVSTVIHDPENLPSSLDAAAEFVARADGHLVALCLGVDHTNPGAFYAGAGALALQESINLAVEDARQEESAVTDILKRAGVAFEVRALSAQVGALSRTVAEHCALSDLAILPVPYGEGRDQTDAVILEGALFAARLPVLILPETAKTPLEFNRPLIAWNESLEALAAIRAAMPLLSEAESVDIVIVDPPRHGPERSDPGGQLAAMLHRHGVRGNVAVLSRSMSSVADILTQYARENGNDLVVMGAYGHSRLREAILGGATRDMLERTTLPVFMAH